MAAITPSAAAEILPVRLEDIEASITEFDLAATRDAAGKIIGVDEDALRKVLAARGFVLDQQDHCAGIGARINTLTAMIERQVKANGSSFFAALAALGALGAAALSAWAMWENETVLSARTSYEVRSAISDRLAAAVTARAREVTAREVVSAATDPVKKAALEREAALEARYVRIHISDLDARVGLLVGLRKAGVIEDAEWTSALQELCGNLVPNNYFGFADRFVKTEPTCDEAIKNNEWPGPLQTEDQKPAAQTPEKQKPTDEGGDG